MKTKGMYKAIILEANGGSILKETQWLPTVVIAEATGRAEAKRHPGMKEIVVVDRTRTTVKSPILVGKESI